MLMHAYLEKKYVDVIDEMLPHLTKHWKELALHQDKRPLDINHEGYKKLCDAGILKILTVYGYEGDEKSKLLGYASFIINTHLHYKTWKVAVCDVYYVDPEHRKSGLGTQFFNAIKDWLKAKNVNEIVMQDKVHKPHGGLFKAIGFEHTENNYNLVF